MTEQPDAAGQAIDLAHLRSMTLGDSTLEREVLSLVQTHAALLMEKMRGGEPDSIPALAHALKGSALGIGATEVARAADALQRVPAEQAAMLRLERTFAAAQAAIAGMLARVSE
jgi:HPt (histidine-containing phosphotransfer) domain-containing protein